MKVVSALPKGWKMQKAHECLALNESGIWGEEPDGKTDCDVLRSTNIQENEWVFDDVARRSISEKQIARYRLQEGDVLITKSSGSAKHIGKMAYVNKNVSQRNAVFANFMQRIRPRKDVVEARYFFHFISREAVRQDLLKASITTTGLRNLKPSAIDKLDIAIPPPPTQRKIVEILDAADALRKKRREADEKMKGLIPALFVKMFGDPAANPMGWKMKPLCGKNGICNLKNGNPFKTSDWKQQGIPIIRIQNLNDRDKPYNYYDGDISKKILIHSGDLLLSWSGTPGTSFGCFVWSGEAGVLNQHIFKVTLNDNTVLPEYFRVCVNQLLNELIKRAHGGVGLQHVTKSQLATVRIPIPPAELQKDFSVAIEEYNFIRNKAESSSQHISSLFDTLLYKAFRGELLA